MDRELVIKTGWWALVTVIVIIPLFLFIDRPVDLAAHGLKGGLWASAGANLSQAAGHMLFNTLLFAGFLWAGLDILLNGPGPRSRSVVYCCLSVAAAMLMGDFLKWFFGRYRPEVLFEQGLYGFSFFSDKYTHNSFPSGHTLRIFSLMTAFSLLAPRFRPPFLALAVLVGASRVLVTKHYPSDVVAGAFLGVFCALWVWRIMDMNGIGRHTGREKPIR